MEKSLIEAGYRLVPLLDGQKRPRDNNWGQNSYSADDLGNQVGLVVEKGMVDVDLDWPEMRRIFTDGNYNTLVWGRKGEVTHLIYRSDLDRPVTFKLPKVTGAPLLTGDHAYTVCELRTSSEGEAYQAMIPGSTHPDGDKLEWINRQLPIEMPTDSLVGQAGAYAAVAVLTRFYPGEGMRDELALALTGCMVRAEWSEEQITNFMTYLCRLTGDDEIKMRASKARRTLKRLEAGRKVAGIPRAAEILGIPIEWMQEIAFWLGWKKSNPKGTGSAVFLSAQVAEVAKQAWDALSEYRIDGDPGVYAYGEALARVDDGRMQLLDGSGLKFELNRCTTWYTRDDQKWKPVSAPANVVEDMLAARRRDVTVPTLKQVSIVPTFTSDGRLLNENGFDETSGIFLDLQVSVDVPTEPTRQQVWSALRQLWTPISQFPFEDKSDKVHALAMMLEPYMRDMFGPTPLYFINKPAAGTGASLFIETSLFPTLGAWPDAQTPPRSDDEMKKTLTACFVDGIRCVYFDNANVLNSASFASVLTAEVYAARILGVSKMLRVPVQVQWVGSGNNTDLSGELYRRTVDIRMDAKMANPEDRDVSGFRIKDLKSWVRDHQADQVRAALTIIQYWVNLGMPMGSGSKASYEAWAAKMSGLFDCIGVSGFLDTPVERRPEDPEEEVARELFIAMDKAHRGRVNPSGDRNEYGEPVRRAEWSKPVRAGDVVDLVRALNIDFDFGFKDERKAMGAFLTRFNGRIFEFEADTGRNLALKLSKHATSRGTYWFVERSLAG
ncbi:bifunctional DNA primase/polymerase [Ruegeria arenilitoris]|uniref:bifunctional DNA primase/polymerase n=1 Tax=Ruegeria arenilitoris TaxID=1173585 RepID=UPI0014812DC6|nr:bifunctional DNA primase/polymerase [Ruegeria arenilitoris]